MADDDHAGLRTRLARLNLVQPVETLVSRALTADSVDGRHERLLYAWEAVMQITASVLWATCRAATPGVTCRELARPSMGHWVQLMDQSRKCLEQRSGASVLPARRILDALDTRVDAGPSLAAANALIGRIRVLRELERGDFAAQAARFGQQAAPAKSSVRGGRVRDVLSWLPYYRNLTRGHGEPNTKFREGSITALQDALVEFCELGLPTGDFRVVILRASQPDESVATACLMHGIHGQSFTDPALAVAPILETSSPFLYHDSGVWIPLYPVAAATYERDEWLLGWLRREVRVPIFSYYDPRPWRVFSERVPGAARAELLGRDEESPALDDDTLKLAPWRGLLPYRELHNKLFFGRERDVERILGRLETRRTAILCGASGAGKSSLALAGVVPRLRAEARSGWRDFELIVVQPGPHPLTTLRNALRATWESKSWSKVIDRLVPRSAPPAEGGLRDAVARRGEEGRFVVLVVDQLEEVTTLCQDPTERRAYLDHLAGLMRQCPTHARVVATVRADQLGRLLQHEELRQILSDALEPVGALDPDDLEAVIRGPLEGRDVQVENKLVRRIVRDAGAEPGALALMSQALHQLWNGVTREQRRLTLEEYEQLGGLAGVIQREADGAATQWCEDLDKPDSPRLRMLTRVLLQLVQLDDVGVRTRRKVSVESLAETAAVDLATIGEILVPFVERRLLVASSPDEPARANDASVVGGATYRVVEGESSDPGAGLRDVMELSGGQATIQVAHEALFDAWPTYKRLLDENAAVLRLRQSVEEAARRWSASGMKRELWSDATARLRQAEDWLARGQLMLTGEQQAFLVASRRRVRRQRRLSWIVAGTTTTLACVAAGTSWYATRARRVAEDAATAQAVEVIRAQRYLALGGQSRSGLWSSERVVLAAAAAFPRGEYTESPRIVEARASNMAAGWRAGLARATTTPLPYVFQLPPPTPAEFLAGIEFQPFTEADGGQFSARWGTDCGWYTWHYLSGKSVSEPTKCDSTVLDADFSSRPDRSVSVRSRQDGSLSIVLSQGDDEVVLKSFKGDSSRPPKPKISANGTLVALHELVHGTSVWSAENGTKLWSANETLAPKSWLHFAGGGAYLLESANDEMRESRIRLYEASSGRVRLEATAMNCSPEPRLSPHETVALYACDVRAVGFQAATSPAPSFLVVDIDNQRWEVLRPGIPNVDGAAILDDRSVLLSQCGAENRLILWKDGKSVVVQADLSTLQLRNTNRKNISIPTGRLIAVSRDGTLVALGGGVDFELISIPDRAVLLRHEGTPTAMDFTVNGERLFVALRDGRILCFDLAAIRAVEQVNIPGDTCYVHPDERAQVALSADGSTVAFERCLKEKDRQVAGVVVQAAELSQARESFMAVANAPWFDDLWLSSDGNSVVAQFNQAAFVLSKQEAVTDKGTKAVPRGDMRLIAKDAFGANGGPGAVSKSGLFFAASSFDGGTRVYGTDAQNRVLSGFEGTTLAFSPSEESILLHSSSESDAPTVVDVVTRRSRCAAGPFADIRWAGWSGDGTIFAAAAPTGSLRELRVYDGKTCALLRSRRFPMVGLNALFVSQSGQQIAVGVLKQADTGRPGVEVVGGADLGSIWAADSRNMFDALAFQGQSGRLVAAGFPQLYFFRLTIVSPEEAWERASRSTNLRVCPDGTVVPVIPFPKGGSPWADESACAGDF